MPEPTAKTTIVADAIANLYGQFQGAPNMNAIVASYAIQAQELETVFISLIVNTMLPTAEGEQLDVLGRIVGEERQGRSDDDYRIAIGARIRSNVSNASVEDIIAVLKSAVDRTYEVKDLGYASFLVRLVDDVGTASPTELNAILQRIKGGGVRADFIYSLEDDANSFTLSSSDAIETDALRGLADDAGLNGGALVDVEDENVPRPTPVARAVFWTDQTPLDQLDVKITVTAGNVVRIYWGDTNSDLVTADGTQKTVSHTYSSTGNYKISIEGDVTGITGLDMGGESIFGDLSGFSDLTSLTDLRLNQTAITGDVVGLNTLTSLTRLYLYTTSISGDISGLATMTSMDRMWINATSISGDVSGISGLTSMTNLQIYNTLITGNIGGLSALTSLTSLQLHDTSISGDISQVGVLTSLTLIYFHNTLVSGDIGSLSTLVSLTQLLGYNTSITGDIGDLKTLTSLAFLYLYTNTLNYNLTTLPTWTNNDIRIYSTGLITAMVDNFLIDLAAAGGINGTLNIAGTNAIRSSASDAAKTTLLGNGWTVTVNE
jgi:hypothetical protein